MNSIATTDLEKMLGKSWMYNASVYHFQSFQNNGKLVLQTDKKSMEFHNQAELRFFLKDCLPVQPPPPKPEITAPDVESDNIMAQLKGFLMENIHHVRKDAAYIPQAQSISNQVNTLIKLTNLEINVHKLNNRD